MVMCVLSVSTSARTGKFFPGIIAIRLLQKVLGTYFSCWFKAVVIFEASATNTNQFYLSVYVGFVWFVLMI